MEWVRVGNLTSLLEHTAAGEAARGALCFGGESGARVDWDGGAVERVTRLLVECGEGSQRVGLAVAAESEEEVPAEATRLARLTGARVLRLGRERAEEVTEGLVSREEGMGRVEYAPWVEKAVEELAEAIEGEFPGQGLNGRWMALRLLEGDTEVLMEVNRRLGVNLAKWGEVGQRLERIFEQADGGREGFRREIRAAVDGKVKALTEFGREAERKKHAGGWAWVGWLVAAGLTLVGLLPLLRLIF